jgi:hypothetical protein
MGTSKQLIIALEKADWLDRMLILAGLAFFGLVVLLVLKQVRAASTTLFYLLIRLDSSEFLTVDFVSRSGGLVSFQNLRQLSLWISSNVELFLQRQSHPRQCRKRSLQLHPPSLVL